MMNLLVPHLPVSCTRSTLFPRHQIHMLDCTRNLMATQLSPEVSLMKTDCISFSFVSLRHKVLYANLYTGENSHYTQLSNQEAGIDISGEQILDEQIEVNDNCKPISLIEKIDCKDDTEMERRRKIGLANKGKVPWNKGKKHSAETCEKIKRNTREAMSDPKVRKKMSECPRSRSKQTRAKIGSSLRKLWRKRLQLKRSRDKFVQLWAESIARAAKIGGSDQKQLQWNSYDIMKREIELHRLHGIKLKAMIRKVHKKKTTISQHNVERQLVWENFDLELVRREMLQKEVSLADQIRVAKNKRE